MGVSYEQGTPGLFAGKMVRGMRSWGCGIGWGVISYRTNRQIIVWGVIEPVMRELTTQPCAAGGTSTAIGA